MGTEVRTETKSRTRIAVYLPLTLKRELLHHTAETGRTLSSTVQVAIERFLAGAMPRD